jgi:hypothetical protein
MGYFAPLRPAKGPNSLLNGPYPNPAAALAFIRVCLFPLLRSKLGPETGLSVRPMTTIENDAKIMIIM